MSNYNIDQLYTAIQQLKLYTQQNFPFKQTSFSGTADPSAGSGFPASVGSMYAQKDNNGVLLKIWVKKLVANTGWEDILQGAMGQGIVNWQPNTAYTSFATLTLPTLVWVSANNKIYYNTADFTSSATFAEDLALNRWIDLGAGGGGSSWGGDWDMTGTFASASILATTIPPIYAGQGITNDVVVVGDTSTLTMSGIGQVFGLTNFNIGVPSTGKFYFFWSPGALVGSPTGAVNNISIGDVYNQPFFSLKLVQASGLVVGNSTVVDPDFLAGDTVALAFDMDTGLVSLTTPKVNIPDLSVFHPSGVCTTWAASPITSLLSVYSSSDLGVVSISNRLSSTNNFGLTYTPPVGYTSLGALGDATPPVGAAVGKQYRVTAPGVFNTVRGRTGDIAQFVIGTTNIVVTRPDALVPADLATLSGWSPMLAVVTVDSVTEVFQVADWVGGIGPKPTIGEYVGSTGLTTNINQAVNIKGANGLSGKTIHSLIAQPKASLGVEGDFGLDYVKGRLYGPKGASNWGGTDASDFVASNGAVQVNPTTVTLTNTGHYGTSSVALPSNVLTNKHIVGFKVASLSGFYGFDLNIETVSGFVAARITRDTSGGTASLYVYGNYVDTFNTGFVPNELWAYKVDFSVPNISIISPDGVEHGPYTTSFSLDSVIARAKGTYSTTSTIELQPEGNALTAALDNTWLSWQTTPNPYLSIIGSPGIDKTRADPLLLIDDTTLSGATRNILPTDIGKFTRFVSLVGGLPPALLFVPYDDSAFPTGTELHYENATDFGGLIVQSATTLHKPKTSYVYVKPYGSIVLRKVNTAVWELDGDLSEAPSLQDSAVGTNGTITVEPYVKDLVHSTGSLVSNVTIDLTNTAINFNKLVIRSVSGISGLTFTGVGTVIGAPTELKPNKPIILWQDGNYVICIAPETLPGPWTPVSLLNSWTNIVAPAQAAQYRTNGDRVDVRLAIENGTTLTLANFPAGYRPPADIGFTCQIHDNTGAPDFGHLKIIASTGDLVLEHPSSLANHKVWATFSFSTEA